MKKAIDTRAIFEAFFHQILVVHRAKSSKGKVKNITPIAKLPKNMAVLVSLAKNIRDCCA